MSLNALRWGALGAGGVYGVWRQQNLTSFVEKREKAKQEKEEEDLVEEARIAFEAAYNREQALLAAKEGIVIDSNSYKFNADKWMQFALSQMK